MKVLITKMNKIGNSFGFLGPQGVRWFLGIFLFYKGVYFMQHTDMLVQLIQPTDFGLTEMVIFHYVCLAHIMGGIMLFFGLLSRMASIAQIPILLGAVIAHASLGDSTQIIISLGILALLMITTVFGSGKFSVDYSLKMYM